MSFWTALVAIVAIMAFANMRRHRPQSGQPPEWSANADSSSFPGTGPGTAALEREVIDLRRRLEVLERIVTDQRGSQKLADEIEALRDR